MAMKAGKLVSGEFMAETTIRTKPVYLVIVAQNASNNTKKKFNNMCNYRTIPLAEYGSKEQLGKLIGKEIRATLAVIDEGFAKSMISRLDSK
jgi:ribosomal protein L7Ae-like RNA K-turn-binding protein